MKAEVFPPKRGYNGRGILVGLASGGKTVVHVYWIEARERSHRSRMLLYDQMDHSVCVKCTEKLSVDVLDDLEYTAMMSREQRHVASNGPQTQLIVEALCSGESLSAIGSATRTSPPVSVISPRISSVIDLHGTQPVYVLCVVTSLTMPLPNELVRTYTYANVPEGFGLCITTYLGDDRTLKPFAGDPYLLAIPDSGTLAQDLWSLLPSDLRVGLVVKEVDLGTGDVTVTWRTRLEDDGAN
ncbi:IMP cyclohydrolase [Candidatus Latescibacterota bacterium]